MRYLLLLALASCERANPPPKVPDTVVLYDDLLEKELVEYKLPVRDVPFWAGCRLRSVEGDAVILCLQKDFAVRFSCADHPKGHPLSMLLGADSYSVTCR